MKSKLALILIILLLPLTISFAGDMFSLNSIIEQAQEKQTQEKQTKKNQIKKKQTTKKDSTDKFKPVDEMPEIVNLKPPVYPESAKKDGIEGIIYVRILVSENGDVKEVSIAERKGGNEDLEKAALEAAKGTKFKPGKVNGKPVEAWVTLPFKFKLQ